jgi:hypothetical protein
MGLLPKIDLDLGAKIEEFLDLLRQIVTKLDTLIELERERGKPSYTVVGGSGGHNGGNAGGSSPNGTPGGAGGGVGR